MPFEPLDAAAHAVEATGQGRLQSIGTVRREMRCERGLDDERLGYMLARRIIRELAGEVRRQPERMLRTHLLETHVVRGIETRLPRDIACAALKGAEACSIIIALLVRRRELADRLRGFRRDVLMFGQFRLAADARIGGIFGCGCRRSYGCAGPVVLGRRRRRALVCRERRGPRQLRRRENALP